MFIGSVATIQNAMTLLDKGARRINREEYVEGFVDMNEAVRMARAGIAAIRTEDKMYEALLDIYA